MSRTMQRYQTHIRVTFITPGNLDLAVPVLPQPLGEIMMRYPNPWAMAVTGPYAHPLSGRAYGPVWSWGRRVSQQPRHWPTLVWDVDGQRVDPQGAADYNRAFLALGAGPLLVFGGQPVDVAASLQGGGFPGIEAGIRTAQAAIGLRPDGLLVYAAAGALTLGQMALVMAELGCDAALRLNAGGPAYVRTVRGGRSQLIAGEDSHPLPCALVFLNAAAIPMDVAHLFGPLEGGTPILGRALATAVQMENYCHRVNPDAPALADRYLAIGEALGVRGDLAYAQALLETGCFRFGGNVQPWQCNFAGLGSTGVGVQGASFSSPAEGIMAHMQHLYAYATAHPLPDGMVLVDPRFDLVPRGTAPRIGDLNGRWAVPGSNYGQRIDGLLSEILETDPGTARTWSQARAWKSLAGWFLQRLRRGLVGHSDAPRWLARRAVVTTVAAPVAVTATPDGRSELLSVPANRHYPALAQKGDRWRITLPDGRQGWVQDRDVLVSPAAQGAPASLLDAVIVIDPGHGGGDTGARSPHGGKSGAWTEKDLNWQLARRLAEQLRADGVGGQRRLWLTRDSDRSVSLQYRTDLANACGAHLFLSIHHNASGDVRARGTETHCQGGAEQAAATRSASAQLACLVQFEVLAAIDRYNREHCPACCPPHDRGVIQRLLSEADPRSYYFVLRNSAVPAVLTEIVFLTEPGEAACAARADFQAAVAFGLAQAVRRWLEGQFRPDCAVRGPLYGL